MQIIANNVRGNVNPAIMLDPMRDDSVPALFGLTARWFEQLRTVRHRLQRWLPAVSGLPFWSYSAGDLMQTIDSLQHYLDDLGATIERLTDPLAPLSAAAVEEMEQKIASATQIARRLETELANAALAA